jgi:membrane protein implicated in regulation of membrane protease activity
LDEGKLMTLGIALLILGGVLMLAEIHTLTLYLLAVSIACFAAGAVAVAGAGLAPTLGVLAAVTLLGLPLAYGLRKKLKNPEADKATRDDVGNFVSVVHVDQGSIRVAYRGTTWDARLAPSAAGPCPGDTFIIADRQGNTLILESPPPTAASSAA